MRIGNRLFPYPVLNRDENLSEYREGTSFHLEFDLTESGSPIAEGGFLVLSNIRYEMKCKALEELVERGDAKCSLIVECSPCMYRKCFAITNQPQDIRISLSDLNGKVSVSCYLYASSDIQGFSSDELLEAYHGLSFELDKYDILAVDDGVTFTIDHDPTEDNRVASIFTIAKIEQPEVDRIVYESGENRITIQLPSKYYDCYDNIKMYADYNNISFSIIAIPVLTGCLFDIKSEGYESIDDIIAEKRWFGSVYYRYLQVTGKKLDIDTFNNINPFDLAQMALGDASCKGLNDLNEFLLGGKAGEEIELEVDND
jgi:hypothetical protein